MKRLTISVHACTETLALLIAVAWADGRLEDREKAGVRGAAQVLNLSKESRDRLDTLMSQRAGLAGLHVDRLTSRERAFAYVASAWMARIDEHLDVKERLLLDEIAQTLGLPRAQRNDLDRIAKKLEPLPEGVASWSEQVTRLFKAIPPELEEVGDDFEVVFE